MSDLAQHVQGIEAGVSLVAQYVEDLPSQDAILAGWVNLAAQGITNLSNAALRPYDMRRGAFRVLMHVFSSPSGGANPGELAAYLARTPANMTRAANLLVKRGLVTRAHSTEDRRRVELRITPAGRQFVLKLLPRFFPPIRDAFSCLSAKDKHELQRLLQCLVQSMDAVMDR